MNRIYVFLSTIGLFTANAANSIDFYEAESAILKNGATINQHFVDGFAENAKASVEFKINVNKPNRISGIQPITFRYKAKGNVAMMLSVDGSGQKIIFPDTSESNEWRLFTTEARLVNTARTKGINPVLISPLESGKSDIQIDYVALGKPEGNYITLTPSKLTDAELKKRVYELQKRTRVKEMVVVARNFIQSSHNYTYFNEGFNQAVAYMFSAKTDFAL